MNNRWILAAVLAVTLLAAFFTYNRYRVAPELDFSSLKVMDLDGRESTLASIGKKETILCFGASWCGACHQELDELKQVREELGGAEIIVLCDETAEKVEKFRDKGDYPFTFLRLGQPFSAIGVHTLPTTYLLNASGKVVKETTQRINWKDNSTREHLKTILKQ